MADEKIKERECADCKKMFPQNNLRGAVDGRWLCPDCFDRKKHIHRVGEGARKPAA